MKFPENPTKRSGFYSVKELCDHRIFAKSLCVTDIAEEMPYGSLKCRMFCRSRHVDHSQGKHAVGPDGVSARSFGATIACPCSARRSYDGGLGPESAGWSRCSARPSIEPNSRCERLNPLRC